ncbi:MAG: hypothetical protein H0T92_11555 [Pyrinomonadaceae bacterium]|nr:hypothetical protein [Pyrinomonadaceae bacterium]
MDSPVHLDLLDLTAQLDTWRQSHRQRARIPDHFYTAAVSLLDRYSVSAICRQTRLRPASLRKHAALHAAPPAPAPPTPFLQLAAADLVPHRAALAADSHARLLFERADGSRLTLHLPTPDPAQLHALCSAFLHS